MKSESSIYIDPEGENSAVELRQWFRLQGVETDPKIVPLQAEAMELAGRIAKLQTQKRILTETINEQYSASAKTGRLGEESFNKVIGEKKKAAGRLNLSEPVAWCGTCRVEITER